MVMEEEWIENAKRCEHFFNPQNKDYRDQKVRREAWEAISREIEVSGKLALYLSYS